MEFLKCYAYYIRLSSHRITLNELWKVMFPLDHSNTYITQTPVLSNAAISHLNMNRKSLAHIHKLQSRNSTSVVSFCRFVEAQVATNSRMGDFIKVDFLFPRSPTANTSENLCSWNLWFIWMWRIESVNIWREWDEADVALDGWYKSALLLAEDDGAVDSVAKTSSKYVHVWIFSQLLLYSYVWCEWIHII